MDVELRFDPAAYPRIYGASLGWKIFLGLGGAAMGIAGLLGVWYFGSGHEVRNTAGLLIMVGISLSLAALGFYCAIAVMRGVVVLMPHAIELRGLFKTLRL